MLRSFGVRVFALAAGSHKAAFPCPPQVRSLELKDDYSLGRLYRHVDARKGAAIVFSESLASTNLCNYHCTDESGCVQQVKRSRTELCRGLQLTSAGPCSIATQNVGSVAAAEL